MTLRRPRWSSIGLLNDLIRPHQERLRNRQAEGLGGLEVDDQIELRGLFDRKIGGLGTFEDFVQIDRGGPHIAREIWAIGHERSSRGKLPDARYRWHSSSRSSALCS